MMMKHSGIDAEWRAALQRVVEDEPPILDHALGRELATE